MSFPKISVIVSVKEPAQHLKRCLDSILLQLLPDIEVICLVSKITENNLNILNTYLNFDSRLQVLRVKEETNLGYIHGLKKANGEFVIFVDSDHFLRPDMLAKMYLKIRENNADVVVCGNYSFDENIQQVEETVYIDKEEKRKNRFLLYKTVCWNKLFRKRIFNRTSIHLYSKDSFDEDLLFSCIALVGTDKISVLNMPLIYNRINTLRQIITKPSDILRNTLNTFNTLFQIISTLSLKKKDLSLLYNLCISRIRFLFGNIPSNEKLEMLTLIKKRLSPNILNLISPPTKIKVSLIIPVYNMEDFLSKCLNSILNQSLEGVEIICVDDGSTDRSLNVLNRYARKNSRIRVISVEHQGQSIARRVGMEYAKGKYIQFLDADDYLENNTCEYLYLYSEIYGLDMLLFSSKEFEQGGNQEWTIPYHSLSWMPEKFPPVFNKKQLSTILPQLAVTSELTFYRRTFLIKNKISWINQKIAYEDNLFFTECILKARAVGALKPYLCHHCVHFKSTTHQLANNFNEYTIALRLTLQIIQKHSNRKILDLYAEAFSCRLFACFAKLTPNDKIRMAPWLYDFVLTLQREYHFLLPSETVRWCLNYLRDKGREEQTRFMWLAIKSMYMKKKKYILPLITWQKEPYFSLKVLGIPLIYLKPVRIEIPKKKFHREKVFFKFLGIKIWKIRDRLVLN